MIQELDDYMVFVKEQTVNKISDYFKIREAARFLGVSANTLRNWEKDKKIVVYRNPQNSYRLYKKEDLQELLNDIKIS